MEKFPTAKVTPTKAKLSGQPGDVSIEIFLEPFELVFEDYSENVDTSIRLDSVNIPTEPKILEGKTFHFPVNPTPGYIDGSVYFFAAHNFRLAS